MLHPVVVAAPFECVAERTAAVARNDDDRRNLGAKRADFGHGHRHLPEKLHQQGLKASVASIDVIDQEYSWHLVVVANRTQQRPVDEEVRGEEVVQRRRRRRCRADVLCLVGGKVVCGLGPPERQHLSGPVPPIERVVGGAALVAVQLDQRGAQRSGQRRGGGGLAHAGRAFQQERLAQPHGQEQGHCQALVGQVVQPVEFGAQRIERGVDGHAVSLAGHRSGRRRCDATS